MPEETGEQGNCDAQTVRENVLNYPFPGLSTQTGQGSKSFHRAGQYSVLRTLYAECRCLCSAATKTCMHYYPFLSLPSSRQSYPKPTHHIRCRAWLLVHGVQVDKLHSQNGRDVNILVLLTQSTPSPIGPVFIDPLQRSEP